MQAIHTNMQVSQVNIQFDEPLVLGGSKGAHYTLHIDGRQPFNKS